MKARDAARFQRETFPHWDQHLFDSMLKFFGVVPDARIRQISRVQRAGVSLAMTVPGIVAHESSKRGGERLKAPSFDRG